jgi:histidinol-phosphate aminotransferase
VAQAAARAALADRDHLERSRALVARELPRLAAALAALGLSPVPSQANFLLVDVKRPGGPIFEALLKRGVIVRGMAGYGLPNHLRITVGTASDNDRLLMTLEEVL